MIVALAQIDATVGDLAGNEARIAGAIAQARDAGAQLVLLPELAVTGYPPEDLLLKEHFLRDAHAVVERLAAEAHGIVALVGFPERSDDVYNALAVLGEGRLQAVYRKTYLPNYGVFDEQRYFQTGRGGALLELDGALIGLTVCEDVWEPGPPASEEALAGATLIVNISASPFHVGKASQRERMLTQRARDSLAAFAYCGLVGGQDELVFDGHSLLIDHEGEVLARGAQFAEELVIAEVDPSAAATARLRDPRHRAVLRRHAPACEVVARLGSAGSRGGGGPEGALPVRREPAELLTGVAEAHGALVLGLCDYVHKNGFRHAVLGLSGGIDSALVACLAVDALGPEHVSVAIMPSPYSSEGTQSDARTLADNLGVERIELSIVPAMEAYEATLRETFAGREPDIAEENLQARIRGNLLMALSNKFGWLVLTTGNKSEMSVGYSTLYGDLAGGFAAIKDCRKMLVYALCEHVNATAGREVIPRSILDRAPSAELRPDQRDEDSLPPYPVLDRILEAYVERDLDRDQIIARGLPEEDVDRVLRLVDHNEYKRRQAPPGIKITTKAFGRDRRMPISQRYRR